MLWSLGGTFWSIRPSVPQTLPELTPPRSPSWAELPSLLSKPQLGHPRVKNTFQLVKRPLLPSRELQSLQILVPKPWSQVCPCSALPCLGHPGSLWAPSHLEAKGRRRLGRMEKGLGKGSRAFRSPQSQAKARDQVPPCPSPSPLPSPAPPSPSRASSSFLVLWQSPIYKDD